GVMRPVTVLDGGAIGWVSRSHLGGGGVDDDR
nr:hypothetical protein [Tanacetum cinerariifolium]